MSVPESHEVTELLVAWSDGDEQALERLAPLVQAELHRLARRYMSRERGDHLLQTSALINEAYLRLIDWKSARWQNRAHFFGVPAARKARPATSRSKTRSSSRTSASPTSSRSTRPSSPSPRLTSARRASSS